MGKITQSKLCQCGCGQRAPIATRNRYDIGHVKGQPIRFIAGHGSKALNINVTHGYNRGHKPSPEYRSYHSAKQRCTNPASKDWSLYGGRGIKFLFQSFAQFYKELGPRPRGKTLDRIKTQAHYEPGNVRWATASQQMKNRRPFSTLARQHMSQSKKGKPWTLKRRKAQK